MSTLTVDAVLSILNSEPLREIFVEVEILSDADIDLDQLSDLAKRRFHVKMQLKPNEIGELVVNESIIHFYPKGTK